MPTCAMHSFAPVATAAERAAELSVLLLGGIASCVAQDAVAPALAARDAAIRLLDGPRADHPDR